MLYTQRYTILYMSKLIKVSDDLHTKLMALRHQGMTRYTNREKFESVENVIRRLLQDVIENGKD